MSLWKSSFLYSPSKHGVKSYAPAFATFYPQGISVLHWHEQSDGEYDPGKHYSHEVDPSFEYIPFLQHWLHVLLHSSSFYFPHAQFLQLSFPSSCWYVPGEQQLHSVWHSLSW